MKKAMVFAGQGAQAVGMGRDLAEAYPECRALYEKADAVLGYSISKVCFEGPEPELTRSDRCQPAIFVTSMACFTALRREMPAARFDAAAGLSLGEWTALHAAGALSFDDTLRILEARGRFMQEACTERPGGMMSVMGLSPDKVADVCRQAGVEPSNFNSPEQTVVSGDRDGIKKAEELAKAAGASKTVVLNVAGAYHSRLMASAAAKLDGILGGIAFKTPEVPVISNVTGKPHGSPDEMRRTMVQQVTSPVQWVESVRRFTADGIKGYVEFGPGRIVSGLVKRIDGAAALNNVQDCSSLKKTVEDLRTREGQG